MIPNRGIETIYARIMGTHTLFAMARNNLFTNLDRIGKTRTHTFLEFNGQTEFGVSQNFGSERNYCWDNTMIDCRNAPNLSQSERLADLQEDIMNNARFLKFKTDVEARMGGFVDIQPFYSVLRGEENMRYNIRRRSKVEDFDIIRMGVKLIADTESDFSMGLKVLKDSENPFKLKSRNMAQNLQIA